MRKVKIDYVILNLFQDLGESFLRCRNEFGMTNINYVIYISNNWRSEPAGFE